MNLVWHTPQEYFRALDVPFVCLGDFLGGSISSVSCFSISATASTSSLSKLRSGDRSDSVPKISFIISVGVIVSAALLVEGTGEPILIALVDGCWSRGMGGVLPALYSVGMDKTFGLSGASEETGVHGDSTLESRLMTALLAGPLPWDELAAGAELLALRPLPGTQDPPAEST